MIGSFFAGLAADIALKGAVDKIFGQKDFKKMEDNERKFHADAIIKNHMVWSMGAGFIPIPIADIFAVTAIQLDMIRQISKIYGIEFKESQGKAIITTLTGSSLARLGANAVKVIPGVGSILGGLTMSVMSGASTYALGEVFKKHFQTGGTFLDFDPARLKKMYKEKFEKGKEMAEDIEQKKKEAKESVHEEVDPKETTPDELVRQLQNIYALKEQGVISEEEFQRLKDRLMMSDWS